MEFVPIRDLCASPRKITELLKKESRLVITSNGRPTAIMLDVDPSSFEDTLTDLRALAAKRALRELQETSVANGTSGMSLEEINEIIAAARRERSAREQDGQC